MLSDFTGADRVFIACGYTDLRRGIDGLASIVQSQFQLDPFTNTLFLFCGRRRDRIKALYWEGNGFVLLYKRLEITGCNTKARDGFNRMIEDALAGRIDLIITKSVSSCL